MQSDPGLVHNGPSAHGRAEKRGGKAAMPDRTHLRERAAFCRGCRCTFIVLSMRAVAFARHFRWACRRSPLYFFLFFQARPPRRLLRKFGGQIGQKERKDGHPSGSTAETDNLSNLSDLSANARTARAAVMSRWLRGQIRPLSKAYGKIGKKGRKDCQATEGTEKIGNLTNLTGVCTRGEIHANQRRPERPLSSAPLPQFVQRVRVAAAIRAGPPQLVQSAPGW